MEAVEMMVNKRDLDESVVYREEQQLESPLMWIVVLLIAGLQWVLTIQHFWYGYYPQIGNVEMAMLWLLLGVLLPLVLFSIRLRVTVRRDGVYVQLWPLQQVPHRVPLHVIERYDVRRYRPVDEFGDYAFRDLAFQRVYNLQGNEGVALELTDGRRLLVGARRPDDLLDALDRALRGG
jgi:hypothetical protein